MKEIDELISEMMILERRLVQVGSGAALGLPCLVWRGSGFAGFGVTLFLLNGFIKLFFFYKWIY